MPCYEPSGKERAEADYNLKHKGKLTTRFIMDLENKATWCEAALCSVFQELERRDIASKVIAEASRNGLIGLMDFWSSHTKNDEARIAKILHQYSKDEQSMMLKILKEEK